MSWLGWAWVVVAVAWVVLAVAWMVLLRRKRQLRHQHQQAVQLTRTAHEYSHSEWEALSNDEKEAAWDRYWGKQ